MILEDTQEIWKDIDGFNGKYAVSNKGNVKNIKTGRILIGQNDVNGYKIVNLKGKQFKVHRLVALMFIPNPQNLPHINHKNERKDDNNVGNLEWVSVSDNVKHSIYKLYRKVKQIDKCGNLIRIWESITQIKRELGYDTSTIIKVCQGKLRSSHNFKWEYVNPESQKVINRPIVVYKGNNYVGEFSSTKKACKALGLKYSSVNFCLQGRSASNKGYSFKYAE